MKMKAHCPDLKFMCHQMEIHVLQESAGPIYKPATGSTNSKTDATSRRPPE